MFRCCETAKTLASRTRRLVQPVPCNWVNYWRRPRTMNITVRISGKGEVRCDISFGFAARILRTMKSSQDSSSAAPTMQHSTKSSGVSDFKAIKRATTMNEVQIAIVMTAEAMPMARGVSRLKNSMPCLSGFERPINQANHSQSSGRKNQQPRQCRCEARQRILAQAPMQQCMHDAKRCIP
jgi:hypothetical protein